MTTTPDENSIKAELNLKPYDTMCEYAINPLAIGTPFPAFSWKFPGNQRGQFQTAYQVLVSNDAEKLMHDVGNVWDTGKVNRGQSIHILYAGQELKIMQTYYWKVRIWDERGRMSPFSEPAFFETGLLGRGDWKGSWIGLPARADKFSHLFRRPFTVHKKVKKARVYISGIGYYELRLNGKKVGDHVLDPAWTDYSKRVLYVAYDISALLNIGDHVVGIVLGMGWFGRPQVIFQMHIEYEDGSGEMVVSDRKSGWLTAKGPMTWNDIYDGEIYDASLEVPDWDTIKLDTENPGIWRQPIIMEGPGGKLVPQSIEPIKVIADLAPVNLTNPKEGVYLFDIGQNIAGWVKLSIREDCKTKVLIKYAEVLSEDGTVNQDNLCGAKSMDIYITKGGGNETYEPNFTYHGFRYIQVEGLQEIPDADSVTGRVVRSSVSSAGEFRCSDDLVNQIHQNIVRTESNNLHGLPTDCPQRDERMAWLNDMTVRSEQAVFNFNLAKLYSKWVDDIADTQGPETGAIADTAPTVLSLVSPFRARGARPADPVSSSYLIVPWLIYLHYGDSRVLEKHYEGLKRWVGYLREQSDDCIVGYSYYGDWASPASQTEAGSLGSAAVSAQTPGDYISTGFYFYNARLLSKIAGVLDKPEDAKEYWSLSEKIKAAMNARYLDKARMTYAKGSQTANAFALYLGIVSPEYQASVLHNLVDDILEKHDCHLTTGNIGTKYLIDVLTDYGREDIAFKLVTQTTYPSWGYMISKGATTIWERWEHRVGSGMNSHNHPMFGSVDAWLYKYLGGIQTDEEGPGFQKMTIKPHLPTGLEFVETKLNTLSGTVISRWAKKDRWIEYQIEIPWNSTARIFIPFDCTACYELSENGIPLWQNGMRAGRSPGIEKVSLASGHIVLEIQSGKYIFISNYFPGQPGSE